MPKYRMREHRQESRQEKNTKFKVKTHVWNDGTLHTEEQLFDSFREAKGFAVTLHGPVHVIKIYNEDGELVFQDSRVPSVGMYA